MKFSYSYLKKLIPAIKNVEDLSEKLTMGLFEIDSVEGDTIDIKVLPNRYSDAASHIGLAREIAAFYGRSYKPFALKNIKAKAKQKIGLVVKDKVRCKRASVWYFEGITIAPSPLWMQSVLRACGMRPINNLVDITNFVMLETGQPLHAFDYDLMASGDLIIRRALPQERLVTLDDRSFDLDSDVLVLADRKDALDVAGIKGGKKAEVSDTTTRILLTACSFDGISIYKTQRKLQLMTDASLRFAHNLSPELVPLGISRAAELIISLCKGVPGQMLDVRNYATSRRIITLNEERVNDLLGTSIPLSQMKKFLTRLGFVVSGSIVTVPLLRTDIQTLEDLAEEIARFYGYEKISPQPLRLSVQPRMSESGFFEFADLVRDACVQYGFDEFYSYSFVNEEASQSKSFWPGEAYALLNPISETQTHLRTSLVHSLTQALNENLKRSAEVRVFEVGKTFHNHGKTLSGVTREVVNLSLAIGGTTSSLVFDLKGVIYDLLSRFGLSRILFVPIDGGITPALQSVRIEANGKALGYLGVLSQYMCIAELDLALLHLEILEERRYKPIPRFPTVVRDISLLVPTSLSIGSLIEAIKQSNSSFIVGVDFLDEYRDLAWKDKQSITLRVVFQSEERTLTSEEVDAEMKAIAGMLQTAYHAEVR